MSESEQVVYPHKQVTCQKKYKSSDKYGIVIVIVLVCHNTGEKQ